MKINILHRIIIANLTVALVFILGTAMVTSGINMPNFAKGVDFAIAGFVWLSVFLTLSYCKFKE